MTQNQDNRADYTDGLRQLADLLDENPDVPLPYQGTRESMPIAIFCFEDAKAVLAKLARRLHGVSKEPDGEYYDLAGRLAGLEIRVTARRSDVCEKVVIGTETVTEMVPDPDAPLVEVTREVEQVEWICSPILSGTNEAPAVTR